MASPESPTAFLEQLSPQERGAWTVQEAQRRLLELTQSAKEISRMVDASDEGFAEEYDRAVESPHLLHKTRNGKRWLEGEMNGIKVFSMMPEGGDTDPLWERYTAWLLLRGLK
jgi:hypothetical protein